MKYSKRRNVKLSVRLSRKRRRNPNIKTIRLHKNIGKHTLRRFGHSGGVPPEDIGQPLATEQPTVVEETSAPLSVNEPPPANALPTVLEEYTDPVLANEPPTAKAPVLEESSANEQIADGQQTTAPLILLPMFFNDTPKSTDDKKKIKAAGETSIDDKTKIKATDDKTKITSKPTTDDIVSKLAQALKFGR